MRFFKVDHSIYEPADDIYERYELATERIFEIPEEGVLAGSLEEYFGVLTGFAQKVIAHYEEHILTEADLDTQVLENIQEEIFYDLMPENYDNSFLSPVYAKSKLGEVGGILSCVYADVLAMYSWAAEQRVDLLVIMLELILQLYGICDLDDEGDIDHALTSEIVSFYHDYQELFIADSVMEMVCPESDYFNRIIMESDLSDTSYLYRYGTYITNNEIRMSSYLASLPEDEIQSMADTLTEGFRMGFELAKKDLSAKTSVGVHFPIGLERVMRCVINNFEKLGLKSNFWREALLSCNGRKGGRISGVYSTPLNKQFIYDHREDDGFYYDKAYVERRLEVAKDTYEKYKDKARTYAGPAVTEVFGNATFVPVNHPENKRYTKEQNHLNVMYRSRMSEILNTYIPGETTCFSIISYPVPEIGDKFEEIFRETVRINTLDYVSYRDMQQNIIDVLDRGEKVHVLGCGGNETDITVYLQPISDPEKETKFENCVADVNIPVGEVFTSPQLEGTEGVLFVSHVYLGDYEFKDLKLTFKEGRVTDYSCANFEDPAEGRKLIFDNILYKHESLPIGEFAIGTNTVAYQVGCKYDILGKFPILIAEKTGPHFAVGDTCYSYSEDVPMYNPNGKEIIPRDNSISRLRDTDFSKAYFNCHTDITIPFEELGLIEVICEDGERIPIIKDGRFVVPGCEELNKPLEELAS